MMVEKHYEKVMGISSEHVRLTRINDVDIRNNDDANDSSQFKLLSLDTLKDAGDCKSS